MYCTKIKSLKPLQAGWKPGVITRNPEVLRKLSLLYELYLRSTPASAGAGRSPVALGSTLEQLEQEAEAFFNLFIFSSPPSPGDFCMLDGA